MVGRWFCSGDREHLTFFDWSSLLLIAKRTRHPVSIFLQIAVDVEYLRMEFILDFEVTEQMRIHWDKNCKEDASAMPPASAPCRWAWTTQQFYFERCAASVTQLSHSCKGSF